MPKPCLGGRVKAPTPSGPVMVSVPRVKHRIGVAAQGQGAQRKGRHGDVLVKLKVMLPPKPDAELEAFLSKQAPENPMIRDRDMQP